MASRGGHLDPDTILSKGSYEAAVGAVEATILASETNNFALVRPPGHHAYPTHSSGFCIFNNIAIAAQKLVNDGKKVLIFDFDGHLGDGISHIFFHSNQVLYWSIHQYPAFPGNGYVDEIGDRDGKGFTINCPLPAHSGDDVFFDAFNSILPVVEQFKPDVVAVSAGFDAHQYDLLLELRFTLETYYKIGKILAERFDRIFATLEGGYNVSVLPQAVYNFMAGINGEKMPHSEPETNTDIKIWSEYETNIQLVLTHLTPYWKI
jgi:acetoin utilization deacetylase AcuC-like enzyme